MDNPGRGGSRGSRGGRPRKPKKRGGGPQKQNQGQGQQQNQGQQGNDALPRAARKSRKKGGGQGRGNLSKPTKEDQAKVKLQYPDVHNRAVAPRVLKKGGSVSSLSNPRQNKRAVNPRHNKRAEQSHFSKQDTRRSKQGYQVHPNEEKQAKVRAQKEKDARLAAIIAETKRRREAEAAAEAEIAALKQSLVDREASVNAAKLSTRDFKRKWTARVALREVNLKGAELRRGFNKKGMDSSIKKTSGFLRKLKMIGEHDAKTLEKDLQKLNMSMYVSEIVNLLQDVVITKESDAIKFITVASGMHQRYSGFTDNLVSGLVARVEAEKPVKPDKSSSSSTTTTSSFKPSSSSSAKSKKTRVGALFSKESATRKNSALQLMSELYLVGILSSPEVVLSNVVQVMRADSKGNDPVHTCLYMVNFFLRYACRLMLGIMSKHDLQAAENVSSYEVDVANTCVQLDINSTIDIPRQAQELIAQFLRGAEPTSKFNRAGLMDDEKAKESFTEMLGKYYAGMSKRFQNMQLSLGKCKRRCDKAEVVMGEVPVKLSEERDSIAESLASLRVGYVQLCELLNQPIVKAPELPPDEDAKMSLVTLAAKTNENPEGMYDDVEQRSFYEDLTDLRLVAPPMLLKATMGTRKERKAAIKEHRDEVRAAAEEAGEEMPSSANVVGAGKSDKAPKPASLSENFDDFYDGKDDWDGDDDEGWSNQHNIMRRNSPMDLLLQDLERVTGKDSLDELTGKFCYENSEKSRAKLIEFLYLADRRRTEMLPLYCRFVATIDKYLSEDVTPVIVTKLVKQFFGLYYSSTQFRLQSRMRNIRYMAELVKFDLLPDRFIFKFWDVLLKKFTGQNITVLCEMLEHCGRYLYLNPKSHIRCQRFLDRTMRLRKSSAYIDENSQVNLENAFYRVKPPTRSATRKRKERTQLQKYVRFLVFNQLTPQSVKSVLNRIRKLPWNYVDCAVYARKCLTNAPRMLYENLDALATTVKLLNRYQYVALDVVNVVTEEVLYGLENPANSERQRRMAYVYFLGCLHNQRLVPRGVLYDMLQRMITAGTQYDAEAKRVHNPADPPGSYFRVKLIITLLDCVHAHLGDTRGQRGKPRHAPKAPQKPSAKTQEFFVLFQRYLFSKGVMPLDLQYALDELMQNKFPGVQVHRSLASVQKAMDELVARRTANRGRPVDAKDDGADEEEEDDDNADGMDDDEGEEAVIELTADAKSGGVLAGLVLDEDDEEDDEDDVDDDDDELAYARGDQQRDREDQAFQAEFDRMMAESVEARHNERRQVIRMTPANRGMMTGGAFSSMRDQSTQQLKTVMKNDTEAVRFKFLTRGATNQKKETAMLRDIYLPVDSEIVENTLVHQMEALQEMNEMKSLMVQGLDGQAEEERLEERAEYLKFKQLEKRNTKKRGKNGGGKVVQPPDGGKRGANWSGLNGVDDLSAEVFGERSAAKPAPVKPPVKTHRNNSKTNWRSK